MKLIVLDCDGTLVDSQNGICEAMVYAFQGFGLTPPPREATLSIVGLSLPEAILAVCTNFPAAAVAAELERELGIPVYDTVALGVWAGLRGRGGRSGGPARPACRKAGSSW